MLNFVGLNLVFDKDAMNPPGINIVNIDNVELHHAEVTHFHVDRNTTNEWTGKKPTEWNNDTIMNASFVNSTNAGNLDYVTNEVNKILVFFGVIPMIPTHSIILTITVVIALLSFGELIARQYMRHSLR